MRKVPEALIAVLEFGERFPRKESKPLVDLGPVWRAWRERQAMAEETRPGAAAQAALRAEKLAALEGVRLPTGAPAWRAAVVRLQEGGLGAEDALLWMVSPHAWLEGATPRDEVEACPGWMSDRLAKALEESLPPGV